MKRRGFARKRDANEPGIVAALRDVGATVLEMDKPADLLVGYRGQTYLLEVKNGNQPPSWQRVTKDQAEFFRTWDGRRAVVVRTMREALAEIGVPESDIRGVVNSFSGFFDEAGEPV